MNRLDSEGMVTGIDSELRGCKDCKTHCFACIERKSARLPFGVSSRPASLAVDRIHVDTVGPVSPAAVTGVVLGDSRR